MTLEQAHLDTFNNNIRTQMLHVLQHFVMAAS